METFVDRAYLTKDKPYDSTVGAYDIIPAKMPLNEFVDKIKEVLILNQDSDKVNYLYLDMVNTYLCVKYKAYTEDEFANVFAKTDAFEMYEETVMRIIAAAFGDKFNGMRRYICSLYD